MKVILTKDVPKLGKKGELHEVSDGYARNFLLARGLATIATEGKLRAVDKEKADVAARQKRELEQAQELAASLKEKPLTIPARAGEGGKLFGSITSQDVAAALQQAHGMEVDKRKIQLDSPIKSLGEHRVKLRLHPKVNAEITVRIQES